MTPTTIRELANLRQEFYALFAEEINASVTINKGNAYSASPSRVSWVDCYKRPNYIYIYAHTAPDDLMPERPLVLRLGVNKGSEVEYMGRREGSSLHHLHPKVLRFDLTLLPNELLDFVPWLTYLLNREGRNSVDMLMPPHPLNCTTLDEIKQHGAWTRNAKAVQSRSCVGAFAG